MKRTIYDYYSHTMFSLEQLIKLALLYKKSLQ